MCRYRRSACRAATRHDDDDDRRAPVSTFFIVSLLPSSSSSSPSSPLFVMQRLRDRCDLIDFSSRLRSPVFYRFTADARAFDSPSSTHHLLRDVSRRTADQRREAHHLSLHTRLSRDRLPSECRSRGKKFGISSPELSRGDPLVDSAERRTSPTVCEKARARFPRYPPRVCASCPLRPAWKTSGKRRNA